MGKENVRSFRYTEEVRKALEAAPGENLSEKFENLVMMAHRAVPDCLDRKRQIEDEIKVLREKAAKLRQQVTDLEQLKRQKEMLYREFENYARMMQEYQKSLKKVVDPLL